LVDIAQLPVPNMV
jgi:hypothetical protein